MKTASVQIRNLKCLDQRIPQSDDSATKIQNWTIHPKTQAFDNRIGFEKLFPNERMFTPFTGLGRIDSCYVWSKHQGAQEWWLFEADGTLYYLKWNTASVPSKETVASGRTIPTNSEPGSFYTPSGRNLIITNGHERPLKFYGWPVYMTVAATSGPIGVSKLGWERIPPPPVAWEQDVSPNTDPEGGNISEVWARTNQAEEPGLGTRTAGEDNKYRWAVTFINRDGSESPISEMSNYVNWTTPTIGDFATKRFVPLIEIPVGPSGTIARRIYRTQNIESVLSEELWFVTQINNNTDTIFYDSVSDDSLVSGAPSPSDSIILPSPRARFSEMFKGCLFIDGGTENDTRLYWSNPSLPDTFSALDFVDVGSKRGGAIMGLHAWYNMLLVFREKSVDVITGNYADGFQVSTLSQSVGSRAPGSIITVPEVGVIFLSDDGFYAVSGGLDGGSRIEISKISSTIMDEIKRISPEALPRAVAVYSSKWREYHCYLAADGEVKPNLGFVYHPDKKGWSTRVDFPVSSLTTTSQDDIVFGHHTGGSGTSTTGLFVISRRRIKDYTIANDGSNYTVDGTAPTSIWRSPWFAMSDESRKKFIKYVTFQILTRGDNVITVNYYKDYGYTSTAAPEYKQQRPDFTEQFVYGTGVIGTDTWEREFATEIKVPIADRAYSHFQVEINSTNDIVFYGYDLEFNVDQTTIIRGKQ